MRRTQIWAAITIAIAMTALVGCSAPDGENASKEDEGKRVSVSNLGGVYEYSAPLKDGRTVTCLVYSNYNQGGLSCDWDNAE